MKVWLVGAGPMAIAYHAVLAEFDVELDVIGRGAESAARFTEATGTPVVQGGLATFARYAQPPDLAIVAVNVLALPEVTWALLDAGVRRILVEKPAGLSSQALDAVAALADVKSADVRVAYNRRYYASVQAARRAITEDGGVTSFAFDFTERADAVAASTHPCEVKAAWFLANSTHVVDLAFDLGGWPATLDARVHGSLDWHPAAARFAGCGETAGGALFHYGADWGGPGRWGVELTTRHRKLILRPLEELQIQRRGSFQVASLELDDTLDRRFKPGLYAMTAAMLAAESRLPSLRRQATMAVSVYRLMVSGGRI